MIPLRARKVAPNPNGAFDALYRLDGNAWEGPVAIDFGDEAPPAASSDSTARRLRIFHFNDLHHALRAPGADGLASPLFSKIVKRHRRALCVAPPDEVVLLLAGGDDHTGTPLDELLGWSAEALAVDPAYAAYSAAGVDAAAIGNHDLDRGSGVLAAGVRRDALFPLLSANLHGASALVAGADYSAAAIGVARGLRIGFVGLLTPIDTRTATPADPGLTVASPLATLRNVLPALAAHADIVVILSHCGYGLDDDAQARAAGAEYLAEGDVAIARLAAALTARPVLVMGAHSHTLLNADGLGPRSLIDGVPIIQAGAHGSHVGEVVATIAPDSTRAEWSLQATVHPLRDTPQQAAGGEVTAYSEVAAAAERHDAAFEAKVIAPLYARVAGRMAAVLALNDGGGELADATVLSERYAGECALMNFVTDALVARTRTFAQGAADFAILNATALAAGLREVSDVTFGDAYRMMPFADCLQLCTLTGGDLLSILASNAHRIVRPEELRDPRTPDVRANLARGFVHLSREVRYTIRVGASAAEATIEDATFDGAPLTSMRARSFRAVITNYLGAGGYREAWNGGPIGAGAGGGMYGKGRVDLRALPKIDTGLVFRNEVIAHLRALGRIGAASGAARDQRLTIR